MIKFRAWDYDEKRMHDVLVIDWLNGLVDLDFGSIEKPFGRVKLMQSTGLKDRCGVEIYEGDVVEIKQQGSIVKHLPNNSVNEIVYKDSAFCVKETWGIGGIEWPIVAGLYYKASEEFEVLGNVHENPKLLEVAK